MAVPPIKIKRSSVSNKVPTTSQISLGELAVNTTDGKLYTTQESGGPGIGTTVIAVNPWSVGIGSTQYNIYFSAGSVGIGTTQFGYYDLDIYSGLPNVGLAVYGGQNTHGNNTIYDGILDFQDGGSGSSSVRIGYRSGINDRPLAPYSNIFIGNEAGASNTVGEANIFIGGGDGETGYGNTDGSHNIFIGDSAGEGHNHGNYNLFLGNYTGDEVGGTPSYTVIIGHGVNESYFAPPDINKDMQLAVGLNTDGNTKYWLLGDENFNVGINTSLITSTLSVGGTVTATSFIGDGSGLTGVTASGTAISVQNDGAFSGLATAINFADNLSVTFSSGIARISGFSTTATGLLRTATQYSATAGQTTFSATYVVGYVDVYMNGIRLSGTEYTATNGTSIVLNEGASLGDIIDIVAFSVNLTYTATSGYSTSSGIATYATTSGVSTNVIGGIGSITQLQVAGISTFTNGPVLIGGGTSTGTTSQRLQVVGVNSGAYIGGNLGIGSTNPTSKLSIVGDTLISGVTTTGLLQVGTGATIISTTGIGSIGIGTANPTSRVHIVGSSTVAGSAPLEISKGTLLTNPENDVFEYDGTNLYHTNNDLTNGFGRAVIPEVQFRRLTTNNVVGLAQSSIFGVGIGSFSVLANTLYEVDCDFYLTKTTAGIVTFSFNVNSGSFTTLNALLSPLTVAQSGAAGTTYNGGTIRGQTANNSSVSSETLAGSTSYGARMKISFIPTANAKFTVQSGTSAGSLTILSDSMIKIVGYASTIKAGNVA